MRSSPGHPSAHFVTMLWFATREAGAAIALVETNAATTATQNFNMTSAFRGCASEFFILPRLDQTSPSGRVNKYVKDAPSRSRPGTMAGEKLMRGITLRDSPAGRSELPGALQVPPVEIQHGMATTPCSLSEKTKKNFLKRTSVVL